MDLRSFPKSATPPGGGHRASDHAVDIDHLLTLTNSRLFRITGNPDVIETRLSLRHLKRLGLKALVFGKPTDGVPASWLASANTEATANAEA